MNKYFKYITWIFLLGLVGCFEKEIFPETPSIEFQGIEFFEVEDSSDSLVLIFSFKDGDGDIGLDQIQDVAPPFHFSDVVFDGDTAILTAESDHNPPYISAPIALLPRFITLRDGVSQNGTQLFREERVDEFQRVGNFQLIGNEDPRLEGNDCDNYIDFTFFFPEESGPDTDRLAQNNIRGFVIPNDNYFNIQIDLYERLPSGDYSRVDFNAIFNTCTDGFDGRIPIFDADATQGTISYALRSNGFTFLQARPLQMRFKIIDRAQNESNLAISPDFFLEDITQ